MAVPAASPDATPPPKSVTDVATPVGATEFSVPVLGTYAVIDLTRAAAK